MAEAVFALCALTSLACAVLLMRSYRATRARLLWWSSLSFAGFAANNILLFVDLLVVPQNDLSLPRAIVAFLSVLAINVGLIWSST